MKNEIKRADARSVDLYVKLLQESQQTKQASTTNGRFVSANRASGTQTTGIPVVTTNLISLSATFSPNIRTASSYDDVLFDPPGGDDQHEKDWEAIVQAGQECPACGDEMEAVLDHGLHWHWKCDCGHKIDGEESERRHQGRFDHMNEPADDFARYASRPSRHFKSRS